MKIADPSLEISGGAPADYISVTDVNSNSGEQTKDRISPRRMDRAKSKSTQMDEINSNPVFLFGSSEFNKSRTIIIRSTPVVTYDEVKHFMGRFTVSNIAISKRLRHALVTLKHGEEAECCVASLNKKQLKEKEVEVNLFRNDNLLCVANLPLTMQETDFRRFAEPFGQIEKCFLMRNQYGRSLGYGFVEFMHNKEKSEQARCQIHLKTIESKVLRCQFVKDTVLTFNHLSSKTLIADNLPDILSSNQAILDFFSICEPPILYQIGIHKRFLGFAVAEFSTAEMAQETFELLKKKDICSSTVQLSFGIPDETVVDTCSCMAAVKNHTFVQNLFHSSILNDIDGDPLAGESYRSPPNDLPSIMNPAIWTLLQQNPDVLEKFVQLMRLLDQQQHVLSSLENVPNSVGNGVIPNHSLSNPNLRISLLSVMLAVQLQQNNGLQPLKQQLGNNAASLKTTVAGNMSSFTFNQPYRETFRQATPGHKRPHFLQSPEPSPEGPYVGQHSQGIGGHYAESHFKYKKI